jgi:palmitoyltransferase
MAKSQDFSACTIQVVAVLCFILLVICYIVFVAPLLWLDTEKNIAFVIYGILVIIVVLLFIRFIHIDPSDPKIIKLQHNFIREQKPSFIDHDWSICYLYANCCYPYDCHLFDKKNNQPIVEEEMMFCTICKAEVGKLSKHCKACDKCIEGFDHHCWWLSRCIGKRNYETFFAMLATLFAIILI